LAEASSGVRGYLLTKNPNFLRPYERSEAGLPLTLQRLRVQILDVQQRELFNELNALALKKSEALAELLRIGGELTPSELTQTLVRDKRVLDDLRTGIDSMLAREEEFRRDSVEEEQEVRQRTVVLTLAAAIAGVLGALLTSLLFSAGIVRRVQQVAANAERLEQGVALLVTDTANDELGQLSDRLARASELLATRSEQLQQARKEAERANRSKTEFLSRTSHELRTPLNAILGFAQLLQRDIHAEDAQKSVMHILKSGRHLLTLIDEVLDIARIETGHLGLTLQRMEADELLSEALALITPLAAAKQIVLFGPGKNPGVYLHADRKRLLQVILNLLSNAVKFNDPGGAVSLSLHAMAAHVRLTVTDNGCGIASDMQARLFTPFDRLGAERRPIEGTGLGLAVSRQLSKAMGGDIGVSSAAGVGSSFWVDIPSAQMGMSAPGTRATAPVAEIRRACTLLYVEDHSSNLVLVEMLLKRYPNVKLISATSGGAGLLLAQQALPDLILLDLQLPDMPGEEVLRHLRASVALKATPVVILSADALAENIARLRSAGANDYLTKPLDVALFLSTLKRYLS